MCPHEEQVGGEVDRLGVIELEFVDLDSADGVPDADSSDLLGKENPLAW